MRPQFSLKVKRTSGCCLELYERASTARVNWEKCESFLIGKWQEKGPPMLPGVLKWSREGINYLGVYLGTEAYQKRNWEGILVKVCAKLS